MTTHVGLPKPFHDDRGFPRCLLRIRDEITARGGAIVGEGLSWRVAHSNQTLPNIEILFDEDGELLIKSGDTWAEFHCTEKWWEPRDLWLHEYPKRYAEHAQASAWRKIASRFIEPFAGSRRRRDYLASDPPTTIEDCLLRFINGEVTEGADLEGRRVTQGYPAWPMSRP